MQFTQPTNNPTTNLHLTSRNGRVLTFYQLRVRVIAKNRYGSNENIFLIRAMLRGAGYIDETELDCHIFDSVIFRGY